MYFSEVLKNVVQILHIQVYRISFNMPVHFNGRWKSPQNVDNSIFQVVVLIFHLKSASNGIPSYWLHDALSIKICSQTGKGIKKKWFYHEISSPYLYLVPSFMIFLHHIAFLLNYISLKVKSFMVVLRYQCNQICSRVIKSENIQLNYDWYAVKFSMGWKLHGIDLLYHDNTLKLLHNLNAS